MDQKTYLKVKGRRMYQYRAVDKYKKTLGFMMSEQRDESAVEAFFKQAVDKSGANQSGLLDVNLN